MRGGGHVSGPGYLYGLVDVFRHGDVQWNSHLRRSGYL